MTSVVKFFFRFDWSDVGSLSCNCNQYYNNNDSAKSYQIELKFEKCVWVAELKASELWVRDQPRFKLGAEIFDGGGHYIT